MKRSVWMILALGVVGCGGGNDADKFAGSWAYVTGSKATVDCGGGMVFPFALDTITETFVVSGDELTKTDSQGCAGLKFTVVANTASLAGGAQSCMTPAAGSNPAATFAPSAYTFVMSSDDKTLSSSVTAMYTPMGGSACAVTGTATLNKK